MIYGQMNPVVMQALRGRLGLGTGIRNAGPASYQMPQFPAGMSQYTPQPQMPGQWGPAMDNPGVVPPHMMWGNGPIGLSGGATLPPPGMHEAPWSLPAPTPIGGPKSPIQQIPGATVPQENPIGPAQQPNKMGAKQGPGRMTPWMY